MKWIRFLVVGIAISAVILAVLTIGCSGDDDCNRCTSDADCRRKQTCRLTALGRRCIKDGKKGCSVELGSNLLGGETELDPQIKVVDEKDGRVEAP